MNSTAGQALVSQTKIANNAATQSGGGAANPDGAATLINDTLNGNTASIARRTKV